MMGRWGSLGLFLLVSTLFACDRDGGNKAPVGDEGTSADARRAVLSSIAERVIRPTYTDLDARMVTLISAAEAWQADPSSDARLADAQAAWREAMLVWQRAEVFQIGPAGAMGKVVGGEDIRDQIYAWPLVNRCRIDQELVERGYADAGRFAAEAVNVRGLGAMEYLLYRKDTTNACPPNGSINRDGLWAPIVPELTERRAAYLVAAARETRTWSTKLVQAWDPAGGDWTGALARAGSGSTRYASSQAALNALSDALFYVEKEVKDMKLARPAGIAECDAELCLDGLELRASGLSREAILANLVAFRDVFTGGPDASPGFDDLLRAAGQGAVADDMLAKIDAADAALRALDGTLEQSLVTRREAVWDAYETFRLPMELLKTSVLSLLDLELPQRAEADND